MLPTTICSRSNLTVSTNIKKYINRERMIKGVVWVLLLSLLGFFREPVLDLLGMIRNRDAVVAYLENFGFLGPLLLLVILFLQVLVAAIPGHVFMVAGAYIYGFFPGLLLAFTGTVLSSQVAFYLARWAGRPLVTRLAPVKVLDKWDGAAEKQGAIFFMFTFMIPIFPSDVMNFVAGLSAISPRKFFLANSIGRLPGVVLMAMIGAYGFRLPLVMWALTVGISIGMFAAWRLYARKAEAN